MSLIFLSLLRLLLKLNCLMRILKLNNLPLLLLLLTMLCSNLLKVLKKHCGAMGYTLDDLKGISPTICQHKINIEPDAKPVVEHQRHFNPKMKDVVKNEVLKLLEAGIIFPISDSR